MSFFRYPGGKKKLNNVIISKIMSLCNNKEFEFREPFFGGGSVGIELLKRNSSSLFGSIKKVWINDFDIGISCLWTSVMKYHEQLKERILGFTPSTSSFYEFQHFLGNEIEKHRGAVVSPAETVDIAFKKIAIHQISYSGLGTMSGGPLGGREQKSDYKIDCRWSPSYLCRKIDKTNELLKNLNISRDMCSCCDFECLLDGSKSIVYLDPPYFEQGGKLYQFSFSEADHIRLSEALKKTQNEWVLSYDDCHQIRSLYSWATIETIGASYSITGIRNKTELLIYANKNDKF